MIEYSKPTPSVPANGEFSEQSRVTVVQNSEGKLSLTQLWEVIVRKKRLPDGFDLNTLYSGIREKLRDPEREVRQHALRVLNDLIPITGMPALDDHMQDLIPELLANLSNPAPALRKGSLDSLRKYLKRSKCRNEMLMKLASSEEDNIVSAVAFLVSKDTSDDVLRKVIAQLWKDLSNPRLNQETVAKSLARIRYILGDERFKILVGLNRYDELQQICDNYGFPIDYSDGDSDVDKVIASEDDNEEDRVILETEITLKTGPAITMKIHEESRLNSFSEGTSDSEDVRQKVGVIKVFEDDSESDYYESARRTPRKVRFGGECVKMRTPESDSSNQEDGGGELRITVSDAISIKTRKSLIPIRITSLPSTPKKTYPGIKRRLHKSTPNLSLGYGNSRIPLRKNSTIWLTVPSGSMRHKDNSKKPAASSSAPPKLNIDTNLAPNSNRAEEIVSPIPVHKGIEILHNLTRSPERKIKPIDPSQIEENEAMEDERIQTRSVLVVPNSVEDKSQENSYSSFQVYSEDQKILAVSSPASSSSVTERLSEVSGDKFNSFLVFSKQKSSSVPSSSSSKNEPDANIKDQQTYNSFQVCPSEKILALQPPVPTSLGDSLNTEFESSKESSTIINAQSPRMAQSHASGNYTPTKQAMDDFPRGNGQRLDQNIEISSFNTDDNLWNKSEALDNLIKMLKQPNTLETLEPGPASLLFEALFACQHLDKLHFLADDALELMVEGLRPGVLEQCLGRLALGICKIGAPSGVSLALLVMKKCPAKNLQLEIVEKCMPHRTREGALQVLMAAARLLPSSEVEVTKITEFAAAALRDRRKRVRHAALETLAAIAQLSSTTEVLEIVSRVTSSFQDYQHLMRVVRTRLSRRQLPTVEMDGTVRYSTPKEQTEVEWLSGINISSSPSSSASSSNHSVNYWRHNSRHEEDRNDNYIGVPNPDESANGGQQQIWAVDPNMLPKMGHGKESGKIPPVFRPIYILQPETVSIPRAGRGYRRYDRGRSFSPPKRHHRPYQDAAGTPGSAHQAPVSESGQQFSTGSDPPPPPPPQFSHVPRKFMYNEGFRKSFSSEQLYVSEKPQHHDNYFSLSSRSSSTSTGSSTRSSVWQRSGIPIPISSEMKLRLRTNASTNTSTGPVIARRSVLNSPVETPVITRISQKENGHVEPVPQGLQQPPQSSGSESSGYFTPPPQAFVKLDTEDHQSESDEVDAHNDRNNNSTDCVDSFNNNSQFVVDNNLQGNVSPSSFESSDANEEINEIKIESLSLKSIVSDKEETRSLRFSVSSLKEPSFSSPVSPTSEERVKSRSEVDLQNFLPDIVNSRKTSTSAPPLKEEVLTNGNLIVTNLEETPASSRKNLTEVEPHLEEVTTQTEVTITRRLSKRLSRTQSRRSVKSTPRSNPESTPKSSRSSGGKPKENLQQALAQMNNPEWEIMIQGLQSLIKIARHNPEIIEAQIHTVCINLARHIKNLRSQVARIACHTASELFTSCRRGLDMELEELAGPLLHRTADTNKFLRADANEALDIMCEHLPLHRVVGVIFSRGCSHQNAVVRSAAMRLFKNLVQRLGAEKIFHSPKDIRDKILQAAANSLTDGSPEARCHGKVLFSFLIGHPNFQRTLLEVVPQSTLRHIAKTLSTIKPYTKT